VNRVIALAHITLLNGLRRNTLWGLAIFALAVETFGILFMDFFGRGLGRVVSDYQFSIMWSAGILFILFYAVQSVAWDDNHRTIDSILSRPISRSEYVLGTLIGLTLLLLLIEGLLALFALIEINWVKSNVDPTYFPIFSLPHFLLCWLTLQLSLVAQLAVVLLLSALIRGAFPVMLCTLAYMLICSGLPVVRESIGQQPDSTAALTLLQWAGAIFPDFGLLDLKDSVVTSQPVATLIGHTLWVPVASLSLYAVVVVLLSCIIYERRDLL